MITGQAQQALLSLQEQASKTGDNYYLERADRALDEIVRHPEIDSPAAFQVRSSLANAGKAMSHRRALVPTASTDADNEGPGPFFRDHGTGDGDFEVVEILQWIDTTSALTQSERRLVHDLACGKDAESMAAMSGVPVARMRERISRVRKVARSAYRVEAAG